MVIQHESKRRVFDPTYGSMTVTAPIDAGGGTNSSDAASALATLKLVPTASVAVFLRTGTTWAIETTITNPNPAGYVYFATSLAMNADGSYFFVGAEGSRKAYAYKRTGTTWALDKTYIASDDTTGNKYGRSINCTQDSSTVIVGAWAGKKAYIIG